MRLLCVCLLLAACPERSPRRYLDAGEETPPDATIARPDAIVGDNPDANIPADAHVVAPPDAEVPTSGSGLVIVMAEAGTAFAEGSFTHTIWMPPVGACDIPATGDSVQVGPAIQVTTSVNQAFSMPWDDQNQYYFAQSPEAFYEPGASFTASAPGDQAPGFQLSVVAPNGMIAPLVPPMARAGDDLKIGWSPVGASLVLVELVDSATAVECSFADTGAGVVPGSFTGQLDGDVTAYVFQVNEAQSTVQGWDMRLWVGTVATADTVLNP